MWRGGAASKVRPTARHRAPFTVVGSTVRMTSTARAHLCRHRSMHLACEQGTHDAIRFTLQPTLLPGSWPTREKYSTVTSSPWHHTTTGKACRAFGEQNVPIPWHGHSHDARTQPESRNPQRKITRTPTRSHPVTCTQSVTHSHQQLHAAANTYVRTKSRTHKHTRPARLGKAERAQRSAPSRTHGGPRMTRPHTDAFR